MKKIKNHKLIENARKYIAYEQRKKKEKEFATNGSRKGGPMGGSSVLKSTGYDVLGGTPMMSGYNTGMTKKSGTHGMGFGRGMSPT